MVLDTNVLLSHLQFLVELKDFAIKGVGRPVLVVPWVVMQELDTLKSSSRGSVQKLAQAAIAFLHHCFSAGHPRIRGQTMEEVCVCVCIRGGERDPCVEHHYLFLRHLFAPHGILPSGGAVSLPIPCYLWMTEFSPDIHKSP